MFVLMFTIFWLFVGFFLFLNWIFFRVQLDLLDLLVQTERKERE